LKITVFKFQKVEDTYRHKGQRRQLVTTLRANGIKNEEILAVIERLPRHFFIDTTFQEAAYENRALPIDADQTISQPYTVAFQTELLEVKKREKILEIGTGSGYQAAVLSMLGARVYTVERIKSLYQQAKTTFEEVGLLGIRSYYRDGNKGMGEFAPFDKILVTAAAETIPTKLIEQLKVGGYLVIPVGKKDEIQRMLRLQKTSEDQEFTQEDFGAFRFVPMLSGKE